MPSALDGSIGLLYTAYKCVCSNVLLNMQYEFKLGYLNCVVKKKEVNCHSKCFIWLFLWVNTRVSYSSDQSVLFQGRDGSCKNKQEIGGREKEEKCGRPSFFFNWEEARNSRHRVQPVLTPHAQPASRFVVGFSCISPVLGHRDQ